MPGEVREPVRTQLEDLQFVHVCKVNRHDASPPVGSNLGLRFRGSAADPENLRLKIRTPDSVARWWPVGHSGPFTECPHKVLYADAGPGSGGCS